MIPLATPLNPTQFIGLSAYLFAATSCGIAWGRSRRTSRHLHDVLEGEAIRENLYGQRVGPQLAALGLLGVAAAAGMGLAFQYLRGRTGATMAVCGTILSLSCWCAEVISLHATDFVFFYTVDGVMLVSLCWVSCSLMTGLGILWEARAARSHACQGAKPAGKPPSSLTSS
jgi:hypothetical protein